MSRGQTPDKRIIYRDYEESLQTGNDRPHTRSFDRSNNKLMVGGARVPC